MSKALPPDAAESYRRAQAANRLQTYDREVATLIPYLTTLAGRIASGEVDATDVARLTTEVNALRRCLPPDVPVYPGDGADGR